MSPYSYSVIFCDVTSLYVQAAVTSLYDTVSMCPTRCYLCHVTVETSHLRQVKISASDDDEDWLIVADSSESCSLLPGDKWVNHIAWTYLEIPKRRFRPWKGICLPQFPATGNPLAKLELVAEMSFFRQKPQFCLPIFSSQVEKVHKQKTFSRWSILFYHANITEL